MRFASSWLSSINWQGANSGGRDDLSHETRVTDCPWRGNIRRGNRGGDVACAQRGRTEPLRAAENGAARGGVQIQRQCIELRPGKGDQRHQGYCWNTAKHQERVAENFARPEQGLAR